MHFQEQMLRISNASVHIIPHGSMSHALMFAREVRLLCMSVPNLNILPFCEPNQPFALCRGHLP
jgi:hypothetical protein